ncbi:MAG: ABC transporter permease [Blautia sp.]
MKGGKWKKTAWRVLWIVGTAVCYLLAVTCYQRMYEGSDLVSVALHGAFPNVNETQKMYELEKEQEVPVDFTMWASLGTQQVSNPDLERHSQVPVTALCSRAELFLPQAMALGEEDEKGCIIDRKTAQELFGSAEATGLSLTVGGNIYEVRDVMEEKERMLLLLGRGEDMVFPMVNLKVPPDSSPKETADAFLMRYHLDGEVVDSSVLYAVSKGLLLLLPLILGIQMVLLLWEAFRGQENSLLRRLFFGTILFFLVAAFLYCFLDFVSISRDMIPSRWSDFGFWSEKWKEKKSALSMFLQSAKSPGQMQQMTVFAQSCVFSLAACLGCFFTLHRKH